MSKAIVGSNAGLEESQKAFLCKLPCGKWGWTDEAKKAAKMSPQRALEVAVRHNKLTGWDYFVIVTNGNSK